MSRGPYQGYHLIAQLPPAPDGAERWSARTSEGASAEVILGGEDVEVWVDSLPSGGPWVRVHSGRDGDRVWALIPDPHARNLLQLRPAPAPIAVAAAREVLVALDAMHRAGLHYGRLHPAGVGFDAVGRLHIRPLYHEPPLADPDGQPPGVATDCWQVGALILYLLGASWPPERRDAADYDLTGLSSERVRLLVAGLLRDRRSWRLSPARKAYQAASAVLRDLPDIEELLTRAARGEYQRPVLPAAERSGDGASVRLSLLGEYTPRAETLPPLSSTMVPEIPSIGALPTPSAPAALEPEEEPPEEPSPLDPGEDAPIVGAALITGLRPRSIAGLEEGPAGGAFDAPEPSAALSMVDPLAGSSAQVAPLPPPGEGDSEEPLEVGGEEDEPLPIDDEDDGEPLEAEENEEENAPDAPLSDPLAVPEPGSLDGEREDLPTDEEPVEAAVLPSLEAEEEDLPTDEEEVDEEPSASEEDQLSMQIHATAIPRDIDERLSATRSLLKIDASIIPPEIAENLLAAEPVLQVRMDLGDEDDDDDGDGDSGEAHNVVDVPEDAFDFAAGLEERAPPGEAIAATYAMDGEPAEPEVAPLAPEPLEPEPLAPEPLEPPAAPVRTEPASYAPPVDEVPVSYAPPRVAYSAPPASSYSEPPAAYSAPPEDDSEEELDDVRGGSILDRTAPPEAGGDWLDSGGPKVTANQDREAELGAGKWTEEGRSMEELARELPNTPARELEIEEGRPWGTIAAVAVLSIIAAVIALLI
jgi:hypothetical protein